MGNRNHSLCSRLQSIRRPARRRIAPNDSVRRLNNDLRDLSDCRVEFRRLSSEFSTEQRYISQRIDSSLAAKMRTDLKMNRERNEASNAHTNSTNLLLPILCRRGRHHSRSNAQRSARRTIFRSNRRQESGNVDIGGSCRIREGRIVRGGENADEGDDLIERCHCSTFIQSFQHRS